MVILEQLQQDYQTDLLQTKRIAVFILNFVMSYFLNRNIQNFT